MTFAQIPAGADLFLDANTFVYHFVADPRLMTIEACSTFGWPYQGIASRLRRHARQIQQLHHFQEAITQIALLGLNIATITEPHIAQAAAFSREHGLLTNDALLIALMQSQGLNHLASDDTDFDRVPGIIRYGST